VKKYLLVDFGSTFTKLTAVDTKKQDIIGTSFSLSTVKTNILIGYQKALDELYKKINEKIIFDEVLACSSASGGLKMAVSGLVPSLTVEGAKRACMGAGAKVDYLFSYRLTSQDITTLKESEIDILLLVGGIDGGNETIVSHNIIEVAKAKLPYPVIYAGNNKLIDTVKYWFDKYELNYFIAPNIMSTINVLRFEETRKIIREIFLTKIIEAKGIKQFENENRTVLYPTPESLLKASLLLADGYQQETGLGDLMVIDVGGATTDVYSMGFGYPKKTDVILKGLEETYDKRTVEGDLGLRVSAASLRDYLNCDSYFYREDINFKKEVEKRIFDHNYISSNENDYYVDKIMASKCVEIATQRHVGTINSYFGGEGLIYFQEGKDLTDIETVIGTGGGLIYQSFRKEVLKNVEKNQDNDLRPKSPKYYIDDDYIMQTMGLLSEKEPLVALKILKKRIVKLDES